MDVKNMILGLARPCWKKGQSGSRHAENLDFPVRKTKLTVICLFVCLFVLWGDRYPVAIGQKADVERKLHNKVLCVIELDISCLALSQSQMRTPNHVFRRENWWQSMNEIRILPTSAQCVLLSTWWRGLAFPVLMTTFCFLQTPGLGKLLNCGEVSGFVGILILSVNAKGRTFLRVL